MGLIQPKPYIHHMKLRTRSYGIQRRRDMSKIIMLKEPHFPPPITYEDIDQEFIRFVEKGLELSYDGKTLTTMRLFSNQRLSEYDQSWSEKDDSGNLLLNFKTVTRENNPQHGDEQGATYNIPGDRYYPMFYVPKLQENGTEAYELYEMKQPMAVNFIYTIGLITNKYELINKFNQLVLDKFKSLECYISPNGHPMPMYLDSISDESEYGIDNRKYYSQSFKVKVSGYIIQEGDYRVTLLPARLNIGVGVNTGGRKNAHKKFVLSKMSEETDSVRLIKRTIPSCSTDPVFKIETIDNTETPHSTILEPVEGEPILVNGEVSDITCGSNEDDYFDDFVDNDNIQPRAKDEEVEDTCECAVDDTEYSPYKNVVVNIIISIPQCKNKVTFTVDKEIEISEINTENVFDFLLKVNNKQIDFNNTIELSSGDSVTVKLTRDDIEKDATITLKGIDPNNVYDETYNPESQLDEEVGEENIEIYG